MFKRYTRYNPPFLKTKITKRLFKKYEIRLKAWYIYNILGLDYLLLFLAKRSKSFIRTLKTDYKHEIQNIEKLYKIDLNSSDKLYFKKELLHGCRICKNCAKRCIKGTDFCSIECANKYNAFDKEKIQKIKKALIGKKLNIETKKKISKSVEKYWKNAPEEHKKSFTNKTPRSFKLNPNKRKLIEKNFKFNLDDYKGSESILSLKCKKCFKIVSIKYRNLLYKLKNNKIVCENCALIEQNNYYFNLFCQPLKEKGLELISVNNKIFTIKCKKHGIYKTSVSNVRLNSGCPKCNLTKAELELQKLFPFGIFNDSKIIAPLELDLYFPDSKIAIEFNGLMWHSFGKSNSKRFNNYIDENKDKFKHKLKTDLCEKKNIELLQIFENEFIDKKDIWISLIKNKLNTGSLKIPARKCTIKEISANEAKYFLEQNHLQGYSNTKIKLGLFYNDELVQVQTFGKPRFNKKIQYELIRMASKLGTNVQGGASKLLKYFERKYKPESIISYANRRWSKGNVYEKLDFKFMYCTEPNFFYLKDGTIFSRYKFQKHKLKDILKDYNSNLSASENMYNNGYRKIYDSGNKVYIKVYNENK